MKISSIKDLDKLKFRKKENSGKEKNQPILIDEVNTIRRRELQRVLNFIMMMDVPILDMIAKIASIACIPLLIILMIMVSGL